MSADHSRTSLPLTHAAASDSAQRNNQPVHSTRGTSSRGRGRGRGRGHSSARGQPSTTRGAPTDPRPEVEKRKEDPRHRAIALHHAHRIQAQKDTEALILDHILTLSSDFPSPATPDAAHPSSSDAQTFKSCLAPFQPADYDNLIQERNIEGLCGYGLCPREHRREDSTGGAGTFRIRYGAPGSGPGGRGREMNIVPKEKLEMWCSDACAERALYIRVQLAQEPVWERRGEDTKALVLLEEGRSTSSGSGSGSGTAGGTAAGGSVGQVTQQLGELSMQTETERNAQLALERGERGDPFGRVDVHVRENQGPAVPPQLRPEDAQGGSIEGYIPTPRSE